jgi:hypothetical protein
MISCCAKQWQARHHGDGRASWPRVPGRQVTKQLLEVDSGVKFRREASFMLRAHGDDNGSRALVPDCQQSVAVPAGTLSGNPLTMTAGIKTLEILDTQAATSTLTRSQHLLLSCCFLQALCLGNLASAAGICAASLLTYCCCRIQCTCRHPVRQPSGHDCWHQDSGDPGQARQLRVP